ncbi:MAG: carboxypeptidase-like regulatory domain-containing protein [Bacteroidales bacterium]|nr:carboxypeptidase-like regulatory domain-containing protein [Bacteroidales bacterium]
MINRKILFSFLILLYPGISHAQILKGTIKNEAGEPVPYSTVYIRELRQGTTANTKGDYELKLPAGKYLVTYQSLGYSPVFYDITLREGTVIRNVILPVQLYEIPEVRISATGEDPAYNIMRKAIGMAPYYLNHINSWKAEVYIKGNLVFNRIPKIIQRSIRMDSGNDRSSETKQIKEGEVYMMESFNEIEFTAPDKYFQRVISVNSTFPDQGDNISPMDIIQASFYQPVMADIAISPLSPQAFTYYKFKYLGANLQGNNTVSKIQVKPRVKSQQLFDGIIYIIEDLWCLHSVDLTNENLAGTLSIEQLYIPFGQDIWMPVSLKFEMEISILGVRADVSYGTSLKYTDVKPNLSLKKPLINVMTGQAVTSPSVSTSDKVISKNQEKIEKILEKDKLTNRDMVTMARIMKKESEKTIPDSIKMNLEIRENRTHLVEKDANRKDSTYWAAIRPIPLTVSEIRSISIRDSIRNELSVSEVRKDTIQNDTIQSDGKKEKNKFAAALKKITLGTTRTGNSGVSIHFGGILDAENLRFNPVDGFVHGVDLRLSGKFSNNRSFYLAPEMDYAFSRERLMWRINGGYNFKKMGQGSVYFRTGIMSSDISTGGSINSLLNSFTSLFLKENYLRLYESRYFTAGLRGEVANGLRIDLSGGYEDRKTLTNNTDFSFFRKSEHYPDNIPDNPWLEADSDPHYSLSDQVHYDLVTNITFTPKQRYRINNGVRIPAGTDWPVFSLMWKHGINKDTETGDPYRHFDMIRFEASKKHEPGAFSEFNWRIRTGGFLNNTYLPFYDFFHFNIQSFYFMLNDYQDAFYLPDYYSLSTPGFFGELHLKYTTPYLLLKYLPVLSNTLIRENLRISWLGSVNQGNYTEISYSLSEIFLLGEAGIYAGFDNLRYRCAGFRFILKFN